MQAAEANPQDQGQSPQPAASWGSLVALPPPQLGSLPDSFKAALAFVGRQHDALSQISELLAHLAHLADQCLQDDTPAPERQELHRHFQDRTRLLEHLAVERLDDELIFTRQDWTVELDPPGNKLIVPGIYRGPERILTLQQTDLLSSRSAREAHQRVVELLEWVAIDQALVTEIRTRLAFVANTSGPSILIQ